MTSNSFHIRPLAFAVLACSSAMMAFIAIIGPVVRQLGLSEWHAGLSVTAAGVLWMLLARPWGALSDRIGRKPVLMRALLGFGAVYVVLAVFIARGLVHPPALAISAFVVIGTRALIGAFYAAIPVTANALIADHVEPTGRAGAMAKLGAAGALGLVLGPGVGAMLARYGLQWPLYAAALLPWMVLLLLWLRLPSEAATNSSKRPPAPLGLFDIRLRLPMAAAFVAMGCVTIAQVVVGFFALDRLGLDAERGAQAAGYALTAVGLALLVAQSLLMRARTLSAWHCIATGSAIAAIGFGGAAFSHSQATLIAAYAIAAFGMGFVFPSFQAAAANAVESHEQGAAAGTVATAQGLGMIVGPLAGALLYRVSPAVPFILVAVVLAALSLSAIRVARA